MKQEEIWDDQAAESYDTPGTGMFAFDVLGPCVDRLAELAGGGGALEFAIGTGRVAIPLRARGVHVSGIELSPPMVDELRKKADAQSIPVVIGDMAKTTITGNFGIVYLVFNGISNLLSQAEQVECFRNAARHLAKGGRFVIELWVPELPLMPPAAQAVVGRFRLGYMLVDTFDVADQQVVSHHFAFAGGKAASLFRSPHRYVWPSELDLMGQLAGFELESRHADWLGSPFTSSARSHVSVYRLS
jgi:SAM-dependent methyltransferase